MIKFGVKVGLKLQNSVYLLFLTSVKNNGQKYTF